MWHLAQLLRGFLWLNAVIVLFFIGALFYTAESNISEMANALSGNEFVIETKPEGFEIPSFLSGIFPERTRYAVREFTGDESNLSFWNKVYTLRYRVWIPHNNGYHSLDFHMGGIIGLFLKLLMALAVLELIHLAGSVKRGFRAIRRGLAPIATLAEKAKNINAFQPPHQIRDLTGKIKNINASRLDTRLSVSTAQSELKELTGAINGMLDRINESYRSQMRFVSDASHELRTPIAVIQGYANLLDRWGKNDEKALEESINAIKSEAASMKELVEQLLFLARGDNDSLKLNLEEVDLTALVSEIIRETEMIDPGHQFSFVSKDSVTIVCDAQLIKQAVRIFVDNSIKYTPAGERISASVYKEDDSVKVVVQDNGIGISPENLPYVFDRFYRSDDSRARKTGGTGLGLSIAKWIIERHGGTAEILSRKDIGTRVTITLIN